MSVQQLVVRERHNNPCATLKQIADKYGVTKERVRQILSAADLPTRHWKQGYICNSCGREFYPAYGHSKLFCGTDCRKEYGLVTVECEACGKLYQMSYFELIRKVVKLGQRHFYCSRRCNGKATGQQWGFNIHPKNRYCVNKRQPSKWAKYIPEIKAMLLKSWYLNNILVELGIPKGSYCLIKKLVAEKTP
jgi:hypothetical protein